MDADTDKDPSGDLIRVLYILALMVKKDEEKLEYLR